MPATRRRPALLIPFVSLTTSAAAWTLAARALGRNDAWDHLGYFTVYLPVATLLALGLGLWRGRAALTLVAAWTAGQALGLLVGAWPDRLGLWPIALGLLVVAHAPAAGLAALGAFLARRRAPAAAELERTRGPDA